VALFRLSRGHIFVSPLGRAGGDRPATDGLRGDKRMVRSDDVDWSYDL
jgi:hypothetical protein